MMKEFEATYNTPEAQAAAMNSAQNPPKTGNPKDDEQVSAIEVQHFVKKEGKPWGFEAVAGMDNLKEELKNSFIKPLKFKFLIEKLRKEEDARDVIPANAGIQKTEILDSVTSTE